MSRFYSNTLKNLKPYVPGEQPKDKKYIKLNTNENPYTPSPKVVSAIQNIDLIDLKLYPDPNCDRLKDVIANKFRLERDNIFVGNGSDEVLGFCFPAFFDKEDTVLFPNITYSFYPVYSGLFGINYKQIELDSDFNVDIRKYNQKSKGVIIANPNAPTGIILPINEIEELAKQDKDRLVIVDEAYIDFDENNVSALTLINKYDNILVVRTLSKSCSLAGMRIGFAMGSKELIRGLESIKNSFNSYTLDRIAIEAGVKAIEDSQYYEEINKKIINTRERVIEALTKKGFYVTDSKANFIFVTHNEIPAKELFTELRNKGILVRYFNSEGINNYLRITIGTDEEMDALLSNI